MKPSFFNHQVTNVHAAALVLGAAGLLSRLLGVLRDRMLAAEFGAGRELDIYYAAFQIPDFMAALFLLGAASAAVLPIFQEYLARDREKARDFISSLSLIFFLGAAAAGLIAFAAAPALVPLVAPGFYPGEQALVVKLTRLMLLSPILLGLSGIFSVVVQSFQRFFVFALAPILYNLGIMVGIAVLAPRWGLAGLGTGVILGAAMHFGLQFGAAVKLGFGPIHPIGPISPIGRVLVLSFPRVLAVSLSQLTLIALIAIGSVLAEGSVAVFTLAYNLYFVPIGIFGLSYATAIFPRLSQAAAVRDGAEFYRELFAGIRGILFWVAPSAALFLVLRAHIVRAALGAGVFSWEDTRLTAAVLASLVCAMAAGALQTLLIRGFYALGNTWTPFTVNAASSVLSVALALFFVGAVGVGRQIAALFRIGDLAHPEALGLGLGFAAGLVVNAFLLYILLLRRAAGLSEGARKSGWTDRETIKIVAAAAVAGAAAYAVRVSFSETLPLVTFARVLTQGFVAGAAGFAAYIGLLSLLRSESLAALHGSIARRLLAVGILPKSWDGEQAKV